MLTIFVKVLKLQSQNITWSTLPVLLWWFPLFWATSFNILKQKSKGQSYSFSHDILSAILIFFKKKSFIRSWGLGCWNWDLPRFNTCTYCRANYIYGGQTFAFEIFLQLMVRLEKLTLEHMSVNAVPFFYNRVSL